MRGLTKLGLLTAAFALSACGGSERTASRPQGRTPANKTPQALRVQLDSAVLEVGATVSVSAVLTYDDGSEADVSGSATWVSSQPGVAAVSASADGAQLVAVAEGTAALSAVEGDLVATQTISVLPAGEPPATVTGLDVGPTSYTVAVGATQAVAARATYSDGANEDVTARASWTSSNPSVVEVSPGSLRAVSAGQATVTVAFGGSSATLSVTVSADTCTYPSGSTAIGLGSTLPRVSWVGATDETGQTVDFSAESFFCDPAYQSATSLVIIVGAEWCPNCPDYMRRANQMQPQIAAAGGVMLYVEIEDRNGQPANHQVAQRTVDNIIGNGVGVRVGDAQTQPTAMVFGAATNAVPTAYVVRKSDMQVIGDQGQDQYLLDFVSLAYEAAGGTRPSNCGPSDEESFEPNDAVAQAGLLTPGMTVSGGICDQNPDFYRVDHPGSWQLDLTFSHAVGDLDVYVWDTAANQPATNPDGSPIGSESATDDESFTHSGPATILVYGYNGATAPYELRLTVR